jgi:hypothetical protein
VECRHAGLLQHVPRSQLNSDSVVQLPPGLVAKQLQETVALTMHEIGIITERCVRPSPTVNRDCNCQLDDSSRSIVALY